MLEKKLDYSNMMASVPEDERLGMWGEKAYIYRGYYTDVDDDKAFHDEEQVDDAIEQSTVSFRLEYGLE